MSFSTGRKKITIRGSNVGHKTIELYESVADITMLNEIETVDFLSPSYDKAGNSAFGSGSSVPGHENYYTQPFLIDGVNYFVNRVPSKETVSRRVINSTDAKFLGDYSLPNATLHLFRSCSLLNSPEFDMYPMNIGWYPLFSDATSETSRNVIWHMEMQIPLGTPEKITKTHTIVLSFGHRPYGGDQDEDMLKASAYNMGTYVHKVLAAIKAKSTADHSISHIMYFDHNINCTQLDPRHQWVPKGYTVPQPSSAGWYTNLILYTQSSPRNFGANTPYKISFWHTETSADSHPTVYFTIRFLEDIVEPDPTFLAKYCNIRRMLEPPVFRYVDTAGNYISLTAGEYYQKANNSGYDFFNMPTSIEEVATLSNLSFNNNV